MTPPNNPTFNSSVEEINPLELLQVVAKRRNTIIKICAVVAILAVMYALLQKNIYTATARILPPQKDVGGGLSALRSQAGGVAEMAASGMEPGGSADLYIGLKSRSEDALLLANIKKLLFSRNG